MTKEERDKVIRILQWLHDNDFLFRSTEEDVKYATKLAIQELEQEPTYYPPCTDCHKKMDEIRRAYNKLKEQEPCDDAISRQQCIDAVNKILAQYVPKIYLYTLPLELEKAITDLPSVSTEKTGQ